MTQTEFEAKGRPLSPISGVDEQKYTKGRSIWVWYGLDILGSEWWLVRGIRKAVSCCHCGELLENGTWCYGPNSNQRYAKRKRLCIPCVWLALEDA